MMPNLKAEKSMRNYSLIGETIVNHEVALKKN
jgi:hypothetical protein